MAKKAFVRYDGKKKIVPGSLILQDKAPKVGTWREVPITDLCCSTNPCAPGGNPIFIPGPDPNESFSFVSFDAPTTRFYIYIECLGDNYNYWELAFDTPPLDNITDFMAYLNSNYSNIGTFSYVTGGIEGAYYLSLTTTTGFLDSIFLNTCPGYDFIVFIQNFNP